MNLNRFLNRAYFLLCISINRIIFTRVYLICFVMRWRKNLKAFLSYVPTIIFRCAQILVFKYVLLLHLKINNQSYHTIKTRRVLLLHCIKFDIIDNNLIARQRLLFIIKMAYQWTKRLNTTYTAVLFLGCR